MAHNLSAQQARNILQALHVLPTDDALVLEALLRLGVRTHELVSIAPTDIDASSLCVHIKAAKGSRDHSVPIDEAFCKRLSAYMRLHKRLGQHLATSTDTQGLKRRIRGLVARARLMGILPAGASAHSLRSGFAALVYQSTHDILLTQALLGHRSINSTLAYTRAIDIDSRRQDVLKAIG